LISSLEKQSFRDFEVILVLEKSRELFARLQDYIKEKEVSNTRLVFNSGPGGLSYARNIGVREARGEILAFIDDDALASRDWLLEAVSAFQKDSNIIGVTGPILPRWEDPAMSWFPEEFYWMFACTGAPEKQPREIRNGYGTNMTFRREAFDKAGMFAADLGAKGGGAAGKKELIGEDTEFSMRVKEKTGKSIFYVPGVLVHHRAYLYRLRWRFIASRAYWEGYTKAVFKKLPYMNQSSNILETEHKLLKRILFKLVPSCVAGLFSRPAASAKRLAVTAVTLFYISIGYFRGSFRKIEIEESSL
jgi:glycosyltransferase involved in cell wall biosynthesis